MNSSTILIILALILVAGGGMYYALPANDAEVSTTEGEMIKEESGGEENKASTAKDDAMTKDEAMVKDEVAMKKDDAMMDTGDAMVDKNNVAKNTGDAMMQKGGGYEAYAPEKLALAEKGKVVLFFRASWCPTCRALDGDIRAHFKDIPADVTILDVNYDTETALKQKYGVTYQHTLVQVDAAGTQIAKWSGSPTLSALLAGIK